jgi:hypothetical protein
MFTYLRAGPRGGVVQRVPELPDVLDDSPGVRAANARLRGLLAERDELIAAQQVEIGLLREQLAALRSQVADLAARVKSNSRNSSKPRRRTGWRSRRRSRCAGSPGGNRAVRRASPARRCSSATIPTRS